MADGTNDHYTRRKALAGLCTTGALAAAGCMSTGREASTTTAANGTIPSREAGIEEWGKRLNEHARQADIDWRQFEGTELTFGMGLHPYSTTTEALLPYFEELTGISVTYEKFAEDQYWLEAEQYLSDESGRFDGIMVGLWSCGGYHYGNGDGGWIEDLNRFIDDPALTDKEWLHMEDFRTDTMELLTFDGDLVGFPNGIEAYGCVGYDKPTFETLGIDEPTTFAELEQAAKTIEESDRDDVPEHGIVSRTSSTTLSSANWATMFKTYGADWIGRDENGEMEAKLDSEAGIASLERFGNMLHQYGPKSPGTYDWYANNTAFSEGRVGIIYSTPQTSGIVSREQIKRTKWLPPLTREGSDERVVDTWIWSTGISTFSKNPEAAWLFIQWANSREANYMLSTKQWENDDPRAGYARMNYVFDRVKDDPSTPNPPDGYERAFRVGMDNVPTDPPPVPVDTPENMDIMSEAAQAMSSVVSGEQTARTALEKAAPAITKHARQIPEEYLTHR